MTSNKTLSYHIICNVIYSDNDTDCYPISHSSVSLQPVYVELGDYQTLPGVDVPPVPQRPFSTLSAKSHSRGNDRIFPPIGNLSEPTRPLPPPPSQPKQTKSTDDTGTTSKVPVSTCIHYLEKMIIMK